MHMPRAFLLAFTFKATVDADAGQRQYRICNDRQETSTIHYRAVTYDGFWGKGSHQYDVNIKPQDCAYPQNIDEDWLKVWWEAYGSGSYQLPTGNALWLIAEQPGFLVTEYDQDPNNVKLSMSFTSLYSNSGSLPGSTYDFDQKIHDGWSTENSLTTDVKASIDASIEGVIEGLTPKVSSSVASELSAASKITNQKSVDIEVKLHLDLSHPVYLYQAQASAFAPGYGNIEGYGGYFTTTSPLPATFVHSQFLV